MDEQNDFRFDLTQAYSLAYGVVAGRESGAGIEFYLKNPNESIKKSLTSAFKSHVDFCRSKLACSKSFADPILVNFKAVSDGEFLRLYKKKYKTGEVINEMSYENQSLQEMGWTYQQRVKILKYFQRPKALIVLCCPKIESVLNFKVNLISDISEVTGIYERLEDMGVVLEKSGFKEAVKKSRKRLVVVTCLYDSAEAFLMGMEECGISERKVLKKVSAVLSMQEMIDESGVYNFCEFAVPSKGKKNFEYLSNAGFILNASIDALAKNKTVFSWRDRKGKVKVN